MRYGSIGFCLILTLTYEICVGEIYKKQELTDSTSILQKKNLPLLSDKIHKLEYERNHLKERIKDLQLLCNRLQEKIQEQQSIITEYENSEKFYDAKKSGDIQKKIFGAWIGDIETIETVINFIKKKLDVNIKFDYINPDLTESINEANALIIACKQGHENIVKLLISNGANVNFVDESGNSPLSYASENGHINVTKTLLENKADVNLANIHGITPLMEACENGHVDVAKVLIENGAYVNTKSNQGLTAIDLAVTNKYQEIENLLIKAGAKTTEYLKGLFLRKSDTPINHKTPSLTTRKASEQVTSTSASGIASTTIKAVASLVASATAKAASQTASKIARKYRNKQQATESGQKAPNQ